MSSIAWRRLTCSSSLVAIMFASSLSVDRQLQFVYRQSMDADIDADRAVSRIAAAIGERAPEQIEEAATGQSSGPRQAPLLQFGGAESGPCARRLERSGGSL